MVFLLFCLLSVLFFVEASTSLSRLSGYHLGFPEGGLILQSSLALLSRMVMFLFMPLLGYLADTNALLIDFRFIVLFYLIVPFSLFLIYFFKYKFIGIYKVLILSVKSYGTFFKFLSVGVAPHGPKYKRVRLKALRKFYFLVFFSYIPYYLAWPALIFLLREFPENRAMIIGLSSVFNGINTIILTMFVDPKLIQFGKYSYINQSIYFDLIVCRWVASFIVIFVLLPLTFL